MFCMELTILFIWNCFMSETSLLFVFLFSIVINIQLFVVYSSQNCFIYNSVFSVVFIIIFFSCCRAVSTYTILLIVQHIQLCFLKEAEGFSKSFRDFRDFVHLHATQNVYMQARDFGDFEGFSFACKSGILGILGIFILHASQGF